MGADGHIQIWRDEAVREKFPDCDELFACLPTHYADSLDGIKYHHCYFGDNIWASWDDPADWYVEPYNEREATDEQLAAKAKKKERLAQFCKWLNEHATHWEVWT